MDVLNLPAFILRWALGAQPLSLPSPSFVLWPNLFLLLSVSSPAFCSSFPLFRPQVGVGGLSGGFLFVPLQAGVGGPAPFCSFAFVPHQGPQLLSPSFPPSLSLRWALSSSGGGGPALFVPLLRSDRRALGFSFVLRWALGGPDLFLLLSRPFLFLLRPQWASGGPGLFLFLLGSRLVFDFGLRVFVLPGQLMVSSDESSSLAALDRGAFQSSFVLLCVRGAQNPSTFRFRPCQTVQSRTCALRSPCGGSLSSEPWPCPLRFRSVA